MKPNRQKSARQEGEGKDPAPPVPESYAPDMGIVYPSRPDEHLEPVPRGHELILDENYPFLDRSIGHRLRSALLYLGIFIIVFAVSPVRFGLKIEGRKNLRKNRKLLRRGALTVSNHVHRWDLLFVLQAVKYRRLYFPAWKENLAGPDRNLIRMAGGIPVPAELRLIKYFNQAFDELHRKRKWFHVFPEGANWPYYQPIRPFKKGMFTMAWRYAIPVIPMAISYRRPRGLRAFCGNRPLITLRIGEPLMPDTALSRREAVQTLRAACHKSMTELAGIKNNPWPCEGD
jgi:1-acyl-sn-glycerol-3-phosphate acyltransferase